MKRIVCALTFAALFYARSASACPQLTVESEDHALVALVEEAFATRADIDTCARVVLTTRGRKTTIAVTLPDGRVALRSVTRREDIVGALEALLRLPANETPVETATEDFPPLPEPAPASILVAAPEQRDVAERAPRPWKSQLGAELALGTGVRIGDRSSVGLGAVFLFDVRSWLIGAQGRYDRYTTADETHASRAGSFAAIGGRRIQLDGVSLDLFAGLGMRIEAEQGDVPARVQRPAPGSVPPPPPRPLDLPRRPEHDNDAPEVVFGARLNFRPRSVLRAFLSVDGAVGPTWSFGLMVGAAVGS